MKKSFLKRAMAAAVAVPVALTQTLLCASFAADTTTEDAAVETIGTLTVDTFMDVEADAAKNVPALVLEDGVYRSYEQVSQWNKAVYGILNGMVSEEAYALDVNALAETITNTAWYAEALKAAMAGDASATMKVNSDNVVITIDTKYDYAADVQKYLADRLGDITLDLGNSVSEGKVELTVTTADLMNSTKVDAAAVITVDGETMDAESLLAYAQTKLDEVKAAAEKAAAGNAELEQAVADLFASYQSKLDKANEKYEEAMSKSKSKSIVDAANFDAIIAEVKAELAGKPGVDKIPDTVAGVLENSTITGMFVEAVGQLNDIVAEKGYSVDITPDDLVAEANSMYTITVNGSVNAGTVAGDAIAYTDDDITADELAALQTYFEELEAAKGYEIVEGSFATVMYVEVAGNAAISTMDGDVQLDVTRLISYEIVDPEQTTTTETDDSTGSETTTDTSDSDDDGSSETSTETSDSDDDGSSETSTETSDSDDDGSSETSTETSDSDDGSSETSTETSDSSGTETEVVKTVTATAKTANFYFSHDDTELTAEMLLESAELVVTTDGVAADPVDVMANISFGVTNTEPDAGLTPETIYEMWGEPYAALPIYAFYTDPDDAEAEPMLIDVEIKVYVGVKGDATLDGAADASDAAKVLMYAAEVGAGNTDAILYTEEYPDVENFAFFLADVNTELKDHTATELTAADSALILAYAAWYGGLDAAPANGEIKAEWDALMNPEVA